MKFKEWLEKAKYKTWFGELCGNTFSLTLALAFISFLNVATEGTLIAIAATSFWWSFKARWNPFRSGFFPALISSTLLQIIYFASGTDMMPVNVMIAMFIGNLILITALSGIFSWVGTWIRNRKIRKTEQAKKDLEEKTSVFSDNLKRLAIITLFFYINMFIVIPTLAKVFAESTGTQISSDEFIENYDPENTYTTKSKIPDVKPKRRVPLESPYGNITSTELEQLEAYCQTNGCDLTTVASQLSQMRLKGVVSMDMYIGILDKVYAPKPVVQWQNTLLIPKVVKSLKNTAKGKKAVPVKVTKKADNRPWYQKAWDGARRFGEEIDNKLIHEPTKFIKEHPWQAAGMAVVGIGLVVAAVVSAPVAAALGVAAVIGAGIASFGLAKAYNNGGWNGVANNVFSKPTISMWKSGDIGGAAGRGTIELLGKALEIAPIVEAPKAAVAVVNGVKALPAAIKAAPQVISNTVSAVKAASEMRVGIGVVIEADLLNSGGVKIVKNLAKNAGDNIKAINPFIKDLPQNPGALAVINSSGKEVVAAGKTGVSESIIAEKKAGEIAGKIPKEELDYTPITQEKFRELPPAPREYNKVQFTNSSYKLKADVSNYKEGAVQHIVEGEVNGRGNVSGMHVAPKSNSSPGRVTHDPSVGENEVFEGTVELYGKAKTSNSGKSTFFPKSWDNEKVISEINSAFENPNKTLIRENVYNVKSKSGIEIELIIDPESGKIISAYPTKP